MLNLTIHHNIHLTREERYALHNGEQVQTVGVSTPVWFYNRLTSEPAREVFCRYFLQNPKKNIPIQILEDGYDIAIPFRKETKLNISNEEWRYLNIHDPDKLDSLYQRTVPEVSSLNLLDIKDGGCGILFYREHDKVKKDDDFLTIIHFVQIGSIEQLESSM